MIYRIYPKKDATLYEDTPRKKQNTGKDEILEIGKLYDTNNTLLLGNSRALLEFNLNDISQSIVLGDITSPQYRLRLENIEQREIQSSYDLYAYPLKESWNEGIGSELDTPHNELNVTWVSRSLDSGWDLSNSTVDKPITPGDIPALDAYYAFAANAGGFTLVDSIKGSGGNSPSLVVEDGVLVLSASNYGGGTANVSASLDEGNVYTIEFDANLGTLSGIDFRIYKPDGSYYDDTEITNYVDQLVGNGSYSIQLTGSAADGDNTTHKIQLTYFDNNGADGSAGSIDNFVIFSKVTKDVILHDQFNINGDVPSTYILNNKILSEENSEATISVQNTKLFMSASNFGGATLNRKVSLQSNAIYTASFSVDPGTIHTQLANGDLSGIVFDIQEPDGRVLGSEIYLENSYVSTITSSQDIIVYFTSQQDGDHNLRFTYFGSGSGDFSGSLDNLKLQSTQVSTGSEYTDFKYDAHWIKNEGGGTWYTSSFHTGKHYYQSLDKYTSNLDVEVTDYVNDWLDGTRVNNGFIVKKSKVDEQSTTKFGSIKFFSSDTNTIYPPVLEVRWDGDTHVPGSLTALNSENIVVYLKNLSTEYKENSKSKIRVYGRERFPERTFSSTSNYNLIKYLPTTTYYSVVDADTEQVIIPFNTTYTKVGCDSEGNYFSYWFNGLQPERFYKFVFRVDQNGTTKYYDDNFFFKVIR
tara:strand:+ start:2372 stop:4462 length:2091 start_codon:yes stop_codon:yes gene_type:complete